MHRPLICASLLTALHMTAAWAQGEYRLPAEDYGKLVLAPNQSLGSAYAVGQANNVFEPVGLLNDDDPLKVLAKAVGRLDLLVDEGGSTYLTTCTGSIVGQYVLTNYHCVPGPSGTVVEASLVLGYYNADSPVQRLTLATEAEQGDPALDYALVRIVDPVPAGIAPLAIADSAIDPYDRMLVLHHPAGGPKMMTRFGCAAASSVTAETALRHRCDTLPGSSGAPILNEYNQIVGLHHSGGYNANDPASFNIGTRMADILAQTQLIAVTDTAPVTPNPDPVVRTESSDGGTEGIMGAINEGIDISK